MTNALALQSQEEKISQVIIQDRHTPAFVEKDIPTPEPEQILVKTQITGISAGTEGMWYNGSAAALKSGRKSYPYFPGYELIGEVIETGADVKDFKTGDIVFTMKPHASHAIIGPQDICFKLPHGFTLENALATALTGTALHAVHRSQITTGDKCAIVGMGVLGFILLQVLVNGLSCRVTAISRGTDKQALAKDLGAQDALPHDEALKLSGQLSIHAAFDTSGTNAGIRTATLLPASQGKVVAAGFYNDPVEVDGEALFAKELTLYGVRATGSPQSNNEYNRWDRKETMELAKDLVLSGKVSLDKLITHKFKPEDIGQAYKMIDTRSEDFLQILLDWR